VEPVITVRSEGDLLTTIKGLRSDDLTQREQAASDLGVFVQRAAEDAQLRTTLDEAWKASAPALAEALRKADGSDEASASLRSSVANSIRSWPVSDPKLIEALIDALRFVADGHDTAAHAASALAAIGEPVLEGAVKAMADPRWQIRAGIADVLGRIDHPQRLERLAALSRDAESTVRRSAVTALVDLQSSEAVPLLAERLARDERGNLIEPLPWIRERALVGLQAADDPRSIAALTSVLADPVLRIRELAREALRALDPDALVMVLSAQVADETLTKEFRDEARRALLSLGPLVLIPPTIESRTLDGKTVETTDGTWPIPEFWMAGIREAQVTRELNTADGPLAIARKVDPQHAWEVVQEFTDITELIRLGDARRFRFYRNPEGNERADAWGRGNPIPLHELKTLEEQRVPIQVWLVGEDGQEYKLEFGHNMASLQGELIASYQRGRQVSVAVLEQLSELEGMPLYDHRTKRTTLQIPLGAVIAKDQYRQPAGVSTAESYGGVGYFFRQLEIINDPQVGRSPYLIPTNVDLKDLEHLDAKDLEKLFKVVFYAYGEPGELDLVDGKTLHGNFSGKLLLEHVRNGVKLQEGEFGYDDPWLWDEVVFAKNAITAEQAQTLLGEFALMVQLGNAKKQLALIDSQIGLEAILVIVNVAGAGNPAVPIATNALRLLFHGWALTKLPNEIEKKEVRTFVEQYLKTTYPEDGEQEVQKDTDQIMALLHQDPDLMRVIHVSHQVRLEALVTYLLQLADISVNLAVSVKDYRDIKERERRAKRALRELEKLAKEHVDLSLEKWRNVLSRMTPEELQRFEQIMGRSFNIAKLQEADIAHILAKIPTLSDADREFLFGDGETVGVLRRLPPQEQAILDALMMLHDNGLNLANAALNIGHLSHEERHELALLLNLAGDEHALDGFPSFHELRDDLKAHNGKFSKAMQKKIEDSMAKVRLAFGKLSDEKKNQVLAIVNTVTPDEAKYRNAIAQIYVDQLNPANLALNIAHLSHEERHELATLLNLDNEHALDEFPSFEQLRDNLQANDGDFSDALQEQIQESMESVQNAYDELSKEQRLQFLATLNVATAEEQAIRAHPFLNPATALPIWEWGEPPGPNYDPFGIPTALYDQFKAEFGLPADLNIASIANPQGSDHNAFSLELVAVAVGNKLSSVSLQEAEQLVTQYHLYLPGEGGGDLSIVVNDLITRGQLAQQLLDLRVEYGGYLTSWGAPGDAGIYKKVAGNLTNIDNLLKKNGGYLTSVGGPGSPEAWDKDSQLLGQVNELASVMRGAIGSPQNISRVGSLVSNLSKLSGGPSRGGIFSVLNNEYVALSGQVNALRVFGKLAGIEGLGQGADLKHLNGLTDLTNLFGVSMELQSVIRTLSDDRLFITSEPLIKDGMPNLRVFRIYFLGFPLQIFSVRAELTEFIELTEDPEVFAIRIRDPQWWEVFGRRKFEPIGTEEAFNQLDLEAVGTVEQRGKDGQVESRLPFYVE